MMNKDEFRGMMVELRHRFQRVVMSEERNECCDDLVYELIKTTREVEKDHLEFYFMEEA